MSALAELIRANKPKSVQQLDRLKTVLEYIPLNTEMILKAADLWAQIRQVGQPTADPNALDGDVILAAQTITINEKLLSQQPMSVTYPDLQQHNIGETFDKRSIGSKGKRDRIYKTSHSSRETPDCFNNANKNSELISLSWGFGKINHRHRDEAFSHGVSQKMDL